MWIDFFMDAIIYYWTKLGHILALLNFLKMKKYIVNPKNKYDEWFNPAVAVRLDYQTILNYPERVSKVKPLSKNMIGKGLIFHLVEITGED